MINLLRVDDITKVMLYFQTSNVHKFNEAREIFQRRGIQIKHIRQEYEEKQADDLDEVVKSVLASLRRGNIFVEDTGLFIDTLRGFPGVYSSYVLKTIGMSGVLKLLMGADDRKAEFVSIVGLKHAGEVKIFKGAVRGSISPRIRGDSGFGYDPIFIPQGFNKTFAEDIILKKETSHRRKALDKLIEYIEREGLR